MGRLVDLGQVSLVDEPRFFGGNSAFRCADVVRSYRVPAEVLDYVRMSITCRFYWFLMWWIRGGRFTAVARELRLAGASAVSSFLFGCYSLVALDNASFIPLTRIYVIFGIFKINGH